MRRNPRRDTAPEIALRKELHRLGLRFRVDYPIRLKTRLVRADIAFTRCRIAIFVDGCFWHRCPEHGNSPKANADYWGPKLDRNVARDQAVNADLLEASWLVLRAWEHEDVPDVAQRIRREVERRANPGQS